MKRIDRKREHPRSPSEEAKWRRERFIIVVATVVIVVLTILGTVLTQKDLDIGVGENILLIALIDINIILLILVIFLVIRNFVKLIFERRKNVEGAKLRTKLVLSFAGLTLFPTLVMFLAAMLFFSGSMDKFFNIQVENSLEGSLDIAQTYYTLSTDKALSAAKEIGNEVANSGLLKSENRKNLKSYVDKQRNISGLGLIKIFSPEMEELTSSVSEDIPKMALEHLNSSLFKEALDGKPVSTIQTTGYGDVVWALYPLTAEEGVKAVVMTANFVPKSMMAKMIETSRFLEEYKRNKLFKESIVVSYLITLSAIALLVVFTATWLGFYLAKGITGPIGLLAEGTRKVAGGDLEVFVDVSVSDEVGTLVDSFNKMTQDLKTQSRRLERAYNELSRSNLELEQRRMYMEIVLKNVAAGVISIDENGIITTINRSAERMVGIKTEKVMNRPFTEVLKPKHYHIIIGLMEELKRSKDGYIQRQVEIPLEDRILILMANANNLVDEDGNYIGIVAVFDDITEAMRAQRMAAWREVARRIAHEIKNPLTPIQLSAQRIRKKYLDKLVDDGEVLDECTRTIITQVDEMKTLVNEFSHFARLPAAKPVLNHLNKIVKETLSLYKDAHKDITYRFIEDKNLPKMKLDKEQIKRALINLLENAVEAVDGDGEIEIETSFRKDLNTANLVISDTGRGIPTDVKERLFEPYYSTKKTGTGLGLTIVNTIVSDHRGYIRVSDNEPKGTKFTIELPVSTL